MSGKQFTLKVIGDYEFSEVSSALQKMIRRGQEYEACYFAYLLHQSGYGEYLWRRLITITSEDIGSGDLMAPILVNALHQSWQAMHKHTKAPELSKFFTVVHAVLYLCRCGKNREDDNLLNLIHEHFEAGVREPIPDVARDVHTNAGKAKFGRTGQKDGRELERWHKWFDESTVVNKPTGDDLWLEGFQALMYERAKKLDSEAIPNGK